MHILGLFHSQISVYVLYLHLEMYKDQHVLHTNEWTKRKKCINSNITHTLNI